MLLLQRKSVKSSLVWSVSIACRAIVVAWLLCGVHAWNVQAAQQAKGTLTGKILDDYGEPLVGANALVKAIFQGAASDMKGEFTLSLPAGTHTVEFAYMGYSTQVVSDVVIKPGEVTHLSVTLLPTATEMEEVVVTATYNKSSAAGALSMQQHMPQVSAVMAAEQISRTPDKNLGEALRRVTGVTTVGNKFVSVRGMGERWNEASLDGIILPSTEASGKAFSFDLVPTALVDNVTVIKTPSPDVTSNFSGALIQISTKDIPVKNFLTLSAGLSFNTQSTFRTQYGRYRSAADWFAIDDGHRDMPKGIEIIKWDAYNPSPELLAQSKLFTRDNFSLYRSLTPPSQNYQLSVGQIYRLGSEEKPHKLGFIASLTYRNTQQQTRILHTQRGSWLDAYQVVGEGLSVSDFRNQGHIYDFNTTLGAIANVGWEVGENRLSFRNLYTRKYDNDLSEILGWGSDDQPQDIAHYQHVNYPTFQDLVQNKLEGTHRAGIVQLHWNLAHTYVGRRQKDVVFTNFMGYEIDGGIFYTGHAPKEGGRLFPLSRAWYINGERDFNVAFDIEVPFKFDWFESKFKAGYDGAYKVNRFEFWEAGYRTLFTGSTPTPPAKLPIEMSFQELLSPEMMIPGGYAWDVRDVTGGGTHEYKGSILQNAMFAMFDHRMTEYVRLVWGARVEHYNYTEISNPTIKIEAIATVDGKKEKPWAIMPSANLTITPFRSFNIRLSYGRSVVRPQFMELSSYRMYSPQLGGVSVNQSVSSTAVDGADVRIEWFPAPGEVISVGGFFRYLKDPIELVKQTNTAGNAFYVLRNSNWARNWGFELELRKSLGFIYHTFFPNLYLSVNATLTQSTVQGVVAKENEETKLYEWVSVEAVRPMYGQVPYMANVGLSYESKTLGVNVAYNYQGRKLVVIADEPYLDEYEAPYHGLDAQVSYRFEEIGLMLKLNASNLLNLPSITYMNNVNDFERNSKGVSEYAEGKGPRYDAGRDPVIYSTRKGIGLSLSLSWTL